jgi:hypothetical protein
MISSERSDDNIYERIIYYFKYWLFQKNKYNKIQFITWETRFALAGENHFKLIDRVLEPIPNMRYIMEEYKV